MKDHTVNKASTDVKPGAVFPVGLSSVIRWVWNKTLKSRHSIHVFVALPCKEVTNCRGLRWVSAVAETRCKMLVSHQFGSGKMYTEDSRWISFRERLSLHSETTWKREVSSYFRKSAGSMGNGVRIMFRKAPQSIESWFVNTVNHPDPELWPTILVSWWGEDWRLKLFQHRSKQESKPQRSRCVLLDSYSERLTGLTNNIVERGKESWTIGTDRDRRSPRRQDDSLLSWH